MVDGAFWAQLAGLFKGAVEAFVGVAGEASLFEFDRVALEGGFGVCGAVAVVEGDGVVPELGVGGVLGSGPEAGVLLFGVLLITLR